MPSVYTRNITTENEYNKTLSAYLYNFETEHIKYKHFQETKVCNKCNQLFLYDYFVYGDSYEKTLKLQCEQHKNNNCNGELIRLYKFF